MRRGSYAGSSRTSPTYHFVHSKTPAISFAIYVFVIAGIDYKSAVVWGGTAITANSCCATMLAPKWKQGMVS